MLPRPHTDFVFEPDPLLLALEIGFGVLILAGALMLWRTVRRKGAQLRCGTRSSGHLSSCAVAVRPPNQVLKWVRGSAWFREGEYRLSPHHLALA